MGHVLAIIFPVFGLIAAGYLCRRIGVLGPASAAELNRFVVWLALPAMLFQNLAKADFASLLQPGFIATYAVAGLGLFAIVLLWQRRCGQSMADASVTALAGAYPNAGYMGFPLTLLLYGDASLVPTTIASMLVVCVMFGLAIVCIEAARQAGQGRVHAWLPRVCLSLLKNPLIAAPLAGGVLAALDWRLPQAADQLLNLLAAAASPCALVSLGLFLASRSGTALHAEQAIRADDSHATRSAWQLTAIKLVLMPALTWLLAVWVFALPAPLWQIAVILAALPTGTGPYMLADMYRRDGLVTARTVLFSTLASTVTLALLIHWLPRA
ncbi:hypothetical protein AAV94_00255 [Lampropedia cohaerens]|uniref:Transporter n=1 Tax=Lampropedia cohaerens TaxID=1610491 RepID=A0A0U1Q3K2_9BURK|nr:AEC family transporter [Lampropedia cohaerens]KKW69353.1 hypothetical protein AAV94_00255 [Lampropedia cohaerens]